MIDKQHIIIADANEHMQTSLINLISKDAAATVYIADTLVELSRLVRTQPPDVLIIDPATFCAGSMEVIQQVSNQYPRTAIIIFSFFTDALLISNAVDAGATGFVSKDAPRSQMVNALGALQRGREYYCSFSKRRLEESQKQKKIKAGKGVTKGLTEKELQILRYSKMGYTNEEIAKKMFLTKRSIDTYKLAIGIKTNCKRTNEMIQYARERKWLE